MREIMTQTLAQEKRELWGHQDRCLHGMLHEQCALCAGLPRTTYTSGHKGGMTFHIPAGPLIYAKKATP